MEGFYCPLPFPLEALVAALDAAPCLVYAASNNSPLVLSTANAYVAATSLPKPPPRGFSSLPLLFPPLHTHSPTLRKKVMGGN